MDFWPFLSEKTKTFVLFVPPASNLGGFGRITLKGKRKTLTMKFITFIINFHVSQSVVHAVRHFILTRGWLTDTQTQNHLANENKQNKYAKLYGHSWCLSVYMLFEHQRPKCTWMYLNTIFIVTFDLFHSNLGNAREKKIHQTSLDRHFNWNNLYNFRKYLYTRKRSLILLTIRPHTRAELSFKIAICLILIPLRFQYSLISQKRCLRFSPIGTWIKDILSAHLLSIASHLGRLTV